MIFKGTPDVTTIVLHHTAVSRTIQFSQVKPVDDHHKGKWGMKSELGYYGGYNFICDPTGDRVQYRKIGEETIANVGMNCDIPERCTAISYCMAGDFRSEKPTDLQVADFRSFISEVKKTYPNIVVKQHKDVQVNRTCAELTEEQLMDIIGQSDSLEDRVKKLESQNKMLLNMVRNLLKEIVNRDDNEE